MTVNFKDCLLEVLEFLGFMFIICTVGVLTPAVLCIYLYSLVTLLSGSVLYIPVFLLSIVAYVAIIALFMSTALYTFSKFAVWFSKYK